MQDVRQISIEDYRYELPDERIALYPLEERDASKLLIYKQGQISSQIYKELPTQLNADTLLVMNNTKVVEARFLFEKETGGAIEVFCLEPADKQLIEIGLMAKGRVRWNCLVGGLSKWKQPELSRKLILNHQEVILTARIIAKKESSVEIEFSWDPDHYHFSDIMSCGGHIPLPPYLHRKAEEEDRERYQTVYAQKQGSVAAPTAGLHFTERLLKDLQHKGIEFAELTLHVGAGTFLPVKSEAMSGHNMHKEWIRVDIALLDRLIHAEGKDIIAVGTTSLRTLETLYWMGVKIKDRPDATLAELEIQQWDPYQTDASGISSTLALQSLRDWLVCNQQTELICTTQLLIAPGYTIRMADAILTNFHQPASTLLLLVAACIGEDWRKVYQYALDHDYRFLSYGDGSLLYCNNRYL
jgi:S-adenosylmethionine:tRNA ribosyltransferase-isomerase